MRTPRRRTFLLALALAAIAAGATAGAVVASQAATTPPGSIARPVIGGLQVGQTLTATPGTWGGTAPFNYVYTWIRSDSGIGTAIVGATSPTYTPSDDDIGHQLMVQVKAENAAGPAWANSTWTPAVTGATAQDTQKLADGRISVLADHVALPNRLVIASVDFTPTRLPARGPVSARVTVVDRFQHPVRGALVQIVALPFGSLTVAHETATEANGIATLTLAARSKALAHVTGGAVALSVRARKAGDDVLAGVTAQRLVQLRLGA